MSRVVDLLESGDVEGLIALLKSEKRTVNHKRDSAGDRGSAIHEALENWAKEKKVPSPADYPEEYRGYLQALAAWLSDTQPEFLASEVRVASAEWGYAGTYDARIRTPMGLTGIIDIKTSKNVYDDHHLQLAAYELAAVEMGEEPTDFQAVVCLQPNGKYKVEGCVAEGHDFLTAVAFFKTLDKIAKARKKR